MLTDAFEEAFYQLDQDRDGVITIQDLERYSSEKNLKDKFIQKWLNLFADEKNVIYYDKFCSTLGIVPAQEKFEHKIYKIDMTNETQKSVTDIISKLRDEDVSISEDTIEKIKRRIENDNGGQWEIKLNPSKEDLKVKYAEDGILYYSPNSKEDTRILIWKVPNAIEDPYKIHQIDMTDETKSSVIGIISEFYEKDKNLTKNSLDQIKNKIASKTEGKWDIEVNPDNESLSVGYGEDGILYYSPDKEDDLKILVWKIPEELQNKNESKIHLIDMTDETKNSVMEIISKFKDEENDLSKDSIKTIKKEIANQVGGEWDIKLDPNSKDLSAKYAEDGLLCFSPKNSQDLRILVWKVPKDSSITNAIIYDCDMSENIKNEILQLVHDKTNDNVVDNDSIISELDKRFGQTWNMQLNPTGKQLKVDYDLDGKIYFSPNSKEEPKIFIWRQDKDKKRGSLCCCGCF